MTRLLLSCTLLVAACGSGPAEGPRAVRTDSAGVEIVANTGAERTLEWRFERLWSSGGAEDGSLALSELGPHQVASDRDGRVYVLDPDGRRVIVLSAEGTSIDTIGRGGGGPGELDAPRALSVDADRTISVYDSGKGGLVRWSASGAPVDFVRIDAPFWGPKLEIAAAGAIFTGLEDGAGAGSHRQRLIAWRDGAARTLARFTRIADRPADFPTCRIRDIPIAPLFAPELSWDAEGDRFAVNAGAPYVIDLYDGVDLVRSIRRDVSPRPVTEAMALEEAGDGMHIAVADCTVPPAEVVRGRGYADVLPTVAWLAISPEDRVWALRSGIGGEPAPVDIFAADGVYLGTLPPGSPFPVAFPLRDRLVAVETDSLDVPRVVSYRVAR